MTRLQNNASEIFSKERTKTKLQLNYKEKIVQNRHLCFLRTSLDGIFEMIRKYLLGKL